MMSKFKATVLVLFVTFLSGLSFAQAQTTIKAPEQENVSDAELEKFATAFQGVQQENQKAQEKMVTIISEKGMKVERFSAIQKATTNPNQKVDATEEEMKTLDEIMVEIKNIQPSIETKMEKAVANSGISVDRYQAIGAALQQNKILQQRFQNIMLAKTQQK